MKRPHKRKRMMWYRLSGSQGQIQNSDMKNRIYWGIKQWMKEADSYWIRSSHVAYVKKKHPVFEVICRCFSIRVSHMKLRPGLGLQSWTAVRRQHFKIVRYCRVIIRSTGDAFRSSSSVMVSSGLAQVSTAGAGPVLETSRCDSRMKGRLRAWRRRQHLCWLLRRSQLQNVCMWLMARQVLSFFQFMLS